MTIQMKSVYECPLCSEPHESTVRFGGFPVIPCPKITPPGNISLFPKKGVALVGPGLWVTEAPTTQSEEEEALRLEISRLQEAQAAPVPADTLAALKAKRDALKAAVDAKNAPPTPPPPTVEETTVPESAGAAGVVVTDPPVVVTEEEQRRETDEERRSRRRRESA